MNPSLLGARGRRQPGNGNGNGNGGERAELELLGRGDARGLHLLARRHAPALYRFAFALLGDSAEAETLVHRSFLAAWEERTSRPESAARGWLLHLCVRAALQGDRGPSTGGAPPRARPLPFPWPERLPNDARLHREVRGGILALPLLHRAVFLLCDVEGEGRRAAAEAVGRTPLQATRLLHEARSALVGAVDAALRNTREIESPPAGP